MGKCSRSKVIEMLDLVWSNCNKATDHAYERLNHSMSNALTLAIGSGFEFESGDFAKIMSNYRTGYWIGESDEWCYRLAVLVGNISAAKDYESLKGREAFIADDVSLNGRDSTFMHGGGYERAKERLAVGFSFPWKGEKVTVTSFSKDGSTVVACSYEERKDPPKCKKCGQHIWSGHQSESRKPKKRFKITRDDIIVDRAERKKRFKLERELLKFDVKTVLAKLGNPKNKAELAKIPVSKIEKVLGELMSA